MVDLLGLQPLMRSNMSTFARSQEDWDTVARWSDTRAEKNRYWGHGGSQSTMLCWTLGVRLKRCRVDVVVHSSPENRSCSQLELGMPYAKPLPQLRRRPCRRFWQPS